MSGVISNMSMMDIWVFNMVIGTIICAMLDTRRGIFIEYTIKDPTLFGLYALGTTLWPMTAIYMIMYRMRSETNGNSRD